MQKNQKNNYLFQQEEYLAKFDKSLKQLEVKYSLPSVVKFCTKCVISNQRPNSAIEFEHTAKSKKETIKFDNNGGVKMCYVENMPFLEESDKTS